MHILKQLIFYIGVAVMLGILSFFWPEEGIKTSWHTFRFPQADTYVSLGNLRKGATAANEEQTPVERIKDLSEEMTLDEKEEPSEYDLQFMAFADSNAARFHLPENNYHYFDPLFAKMDSCLQKGELIHIAHYGDSQIEGDRITAYIRKSLQDKFGGSGPGLLPAEKNDGGSYSVRWFTSNNFEKYIADGCLQREAMGKRYGALAQYVRFEGKSFFNISSKMDSRPSFNRIRLFVGNTSKNFEAKLTDKKGRTLKDVRGNEMKRTIKEANEGASVISWVPGQYMKSCKINLKGEGEVYGVSLESTSGISADNIPMRGSRGTFFTRMDPSLFTYMHNQLNTQLMLLEFGGNAMPLIKSMEDVENYRKLLDMQLKWLKKACPQATMVVMGPSDMGIRVNGTIQSRPFLEENIASMKACALENGIAFWDMYEVMGGHNSMVKWVKQTPQLAASDYTHLTRTGATEMAKIFSNALLNYYEYYQKHIEK